jgi:hypothetical protein
MSWVSDDGLHEGYLLPEFSNGRHGLTILGGGVPIDQVVVSVGYSGGRAHFVTRAASGAVGWRMVCDCRSPFGDHPLLPEAERWRSSFLPRVASPAEKEVHEGRIFAIDEDVAVVGDRVVVGSAVHAMWWRQHVARVEAVREVESARNEVLRANRVLERAVDAAIRAGVEVHTVEHIARSQAIARQSRRAPRRPCDQSREVDPRRSSK